MAELKIEVIIIYADFSVEKSDLLTAAALTRTGVQYIIVVKDGLILREQHGTDYFYLIWTEDWLALEGYDQDEVDKVFFNHPEPNKIENRNYFDVTPIGLKSFENHVIYKGEYMEEWPDLLDMVKEIKRGLR